MRSQQLSLCSIVLGYRVCAFSYSGPWALAESRTSLKPVLEGHKSYYSPSLKRGRGLYRIWVVCHFIRPFVNDGHDFVSAQYFENNFIELN